MLTGGFDHTTGKGWASFSVALCLRPNIPNNYGPTGLGPALFQVVAEGSQLASQQHADTTLEESWGLGKNEEAYGGAVELYSNM